MFPSFQQPHIFRLLECCNDVEKNPGPTKGTKNPLISKFRGKSESKQKAMDSSTNGSGEMDMNRIRILLEEHSNLLRDQRAQTETLKKKFESQNIMTLDFQAELSEIRRNWQSLNGKAANDSRDVQELDKSWKNNLVLFGVPCGDDEEDPMVTLDKVREVLHKKLYISRDIPMSRISRINYGPDCRGHKPIQLCLVNYRDKEELLRKSRLLKGTNIYLSEDFSRKVREHRHELIKFIKEVRTRDPARRMTLRYDKLYMGHDVFFFNDRTNRVEKMQTNLESSANSTFTASLGNLIINDSQNSLQQEVNWIRRPRSRIASRCTTPSSMSPLADNHLQQKDLFHILLSIYGPISETRERKQQQTVRDNHEINEKKLLKSVGFKDNLSEETETPRSSMNGATYQNHTPRNADHAEIDEVLTVIKNDEVCSPPVISPEKKVEKVTTSPREEPIMEVLPFTNNNLVSKTEETNKILPPIPIETGIVSCMDSTAPITNFNSSIVSNSYHNGTIFPAINSSKVLTYENGSNILEKISSNSIKPYSKYESNGYNNGSTSLCTMCKTPGLTSSTYKQIEYTSGRPSTGKVRSQCSCSVGQESGIIKLAMFGEFSMSNLQPKNTGCNFSN
ncbi:unnamed protein product [Lepeophtheirus salmonis]|uniref:(salmon louse) hypothetical protein n=1 Tax=Lepeophtheirus salmonis TaxID=72036 RepID=A0A7R8D5Z8_LEPSM|nr:unnamed protein product [Lepeophtheirus salmonis]CAF3012265.1 unnamed protein product [Lepeophtheirus salmonis]